MRYAKGIIAALIIGLSSAPMHAADHPQAAAASGSLTTIKRTFALHPDMHGYDAWKGWITKQTPLESRVRHADGSLLREVGTITVIVTQAAQTYTALDDLPVPSDNSPPAPLPVRGYADQKLTVRNEAATVYQQWSFVWNDGKWTEVAYAGISCQVHDEPPCKTGTD